jgi:GMP synthase-like glutamine amidotransferase
VRIGILTTGGPAAHFGVPSYAAMIAASLGPAFECEEFDVREREPPPAPRAAQAFVITGSASGVQDPDAWIGRLRDWLRVLEPSVPLVGICFGHQIMAEAYGGVVQQSAAGWGIGMHRYEVRFRETWMDEVRHFVLPAFHRDQVVQEPAGSRVVAGNAFCPCAVLSYENRRAVSLQAHPEFPVDFTRRLIDRCEAKRIVPADRIAVARASLGQADDRLRVFGWLQTFLGREEGSR